MRAVIGPCGRDCVLIYLFQLDDPKVRLFEGNLFWVGEYNTPNLHIRRANTTLI